MTFKSNTRVRMVFGYVVALCVLSWASALLYQEALEFRENRRWVTHTRDVIDELQKFRNRVEEAESAQRGYILTGSQAYLETYDLSVDEARHNLDNVLTLVHDNPQQQVLIVRLRPHFLSELQELALTIRLRKEKGLDPALSRVIEGSEIREIDQIRRLIEIMQNDEKELLGKRTANYEASVTKNEHFLATDVGLQFLLLTLGFVFIYRDFVNRARFALEIGRANNLLNAVVEGSGDGILAKDVDGRYQLINEAGGRFMGWSTDEIIGRTDEALFDAASAQKLAAEDREVLGSGRIIEYERTLTAAGQTRIIASSKAPYRDGAGHVVGVVGVFRDVTDRNRAEQELRETKEAYRRLVEEGQGLICMHDLQGNLLSVNRAAAEILGYAPVNAERGNLRQIPSAPGPSQFRNLSARDRRERRTRRHHARAGSDGDDPLLVLPERSRGRSWQAPLRGGSCAGHYRANPRRARPEIQRGETTDRAGEREKSFRLDFLTQIPNRRAFSEILQLEATRSRRYKRPLALAYIDLDNFKSINDSLGHETGDELLRLIAQTLHANIRSTDTIARLGGDEFALLLPETGKDPALGVITKLRKVLIETVEARKWPVTLSIGLVTFGKPGESVVQMVKVADDLMYAAKSQGKNCVTTAYIEQ